MAAKEHVAYHESGTKKEADPCGSGSSLFPIKPIQKGCQESAGECPQDTPISWAMKVIFPLYCTMAMTTEIAINTTIRIRM